MKIRTNQYIFPPRTKTTTPPDFDGTGAWSVFASLDWIAQYKFNDSRCMVKYNPNGKIELWNRHGERFRDYSPPEILIDQLWQIHADFGLDRGLTTILDGGLLDQKHMAIKDTIVIWDTLVLDDEHLVGTTYQSRYERLAKGTKGFWLFKDQPLGAKLADDVLIPLCFSATGDPTWLDLWQTVEAINLPYPKSSPLIEGLVFKDPNGTLEMGIRENNNSSWMAKSRVETLRHRC